jgi:hypothetical protein
VASASDTSAPLDDISLRSARSREDDDAAG